MPKDIDEVALAVDCRGTLYSGDRFDAVVRPSAEPFLLALEARGVLRFGLTSGSSSSQGAALSQCGIYGLVPTIVGIDKRREFKFVSEWRTVLIDDSAPTGDVQWKLEFLAGKPRSSFSDADWNAFVDAHFVRCAEYRGGADPNPLTDHIDEVLSKLGVDTRR